MLHTRSSQARSRRAVFARPSLSSVIHNPAVRRLPAEQSIAMKYVLVSGGVMSGLGKGISSSSVGLLLQACGMHVTSIKIDPYLVSLRRPRERRSTRRRVFSVWLSG